MGQKMNNVGAMLNNPKTRNIYLMGVGVAILAIVAGVIYTTTGNKAKKEVAGAKVVALPNVEAVPATSDSTRYNKLVEEKNTKEADKAMESGNTFIPVPVNKNAYSTESPIDLLESQGKKNQVEKEVDKPAEFVPPVVELPPEPVKQPVALPPPVVQAPIAQPVVIAPPKPKVKYGTDEDYLLITTLAGISGSKEPYSEFNFKGQQMRESNSNANQQMTAQQSQPNMQMGQASQGQLIAKAGTILNAIVETGINSDEPSPVLAKIVSGELSGTRLIGRINLTGEKVLVSFSTASIPSLQKSVSVNAIAVDPKTSRTSLASDVDNHYFLRYGVMLGAAFLGGYADALKEQNQTCTTSALGTTTCTATNGSSNKQITQQAVGALGKELANETKQKVAQLKPTITVDQGMAIGLLIMEDWYLPQNSQNSQN